MNYELGIMNWLQAAGYKLQGKITNDELGITEFVNYQLVIE
jgi:hypothetical protein